MAEAPFGTEYPEDKPTDPWYNDEMPTLGEVGETPIRLEELFGLEYDDPLWNDFLDQLTYEQLFEITLRGSYKSGMNIPELGVTVEDNKDSPTCVLIDGATQNVYMPDDILTAATWNAELAYQRGRILGNISLWGAGNVGQRVAGWYAPAVNIHRNPFGGRVGEYYSEDGLLAGKMSAQVVRGAQDMGMFTYVKHFAVNNQETNRCGLLTWANEQCMREIYFKPFEICVKEGETRGIMSSLNRFGPRWAGGSYELLTEVLRNEWGFRGTVVTDSFAAWSNADIMLRAGGSLALGWGTLHVAPDSATTINVMRNCAHDVLYSHANSMAINTGNTPTVPKKLAGFSSKTLEIGMVNKEYSDSVADCVTLNTEWYPDLDAQKLSFALAENSSLPEGLTLSADGTISGTPTQQARLSFNVVVTYEDETKEQTFTINIAGEGGMIIYESQNSSLSADVNEACMLAVNDAYIYDPYAEAVTADITYSLANGSRLPSGLSLTEDGIIMGTPDKECRNYSFTVVASALGYGDAEFEYTISILYPLSYNAGVLAEGAYGQSYIADVGTAECDGEVTYSLKEGSVLPAGLSLTEGGYIVGTPTEAGIFNFTVIASSPYAESDEAQYTLRINLAFSTSTSLPYGRAGVAYIGSVATAQGSFDITYSIVGGALPSGMTMAADGTISGTPATPGVYTIMVRAQDGELSTDMLVNLFIDAAAATQSTGSGCTAAYSGAGAAAGLLAVLAAGCAVYAVRRKKN